MRGVYHEKIAQKICQSHRQKKIRHAFRADILYADYDLEFLQRRLVFIGGGNRRFHRRTINQQQVHQVLKKIFLRSDGRIFFCNQPTNLQNFPRHVDLALTIR